MDAKERLEQSIKEMQEMRKVDTDDGVYVDGEKEGGVTMEYVYIVTAGSYSDYRIEAVFDNEEQARKYCDRNNGNFFGEYGVEVYPINNRKTKDTNKPITTVKIDTNGEVVESIEDTYWHIGCASGYETEKIDYVWGNSTRGFDVALKAARDRLNRIQAKKEDLI